MEGQMPGDPHECHLNAARCSELAETAPTPELRRAFIASAEMWRELAAELESDQMFLNTMSEMEFSSQPCEPYEALLSALRLRSRAA
jgi:hypothetical protein